MKIKKESVIQIIVATLLVVAALTLWGFWNDSHAADNSTSIHIVTADSGEHEYKIRVEDGKVTILQDGKPVPDDRILRHGNSRIVLDENGKVIYQAIIDDDGELSYASSVISIPRPPKMASGLYLGVVIGDVDEALAAQLGLDGQGILIRSVIDDSPAAKAKLKEYDIITTVDGKPVSALSDLRAHLAKAEEGDTLKLTVLRKGKKIEIPVKPKEDQGRILRFLNEDDDMIFPGPDHDQGSNSFEYWKQDGGPVRFFRHGDGDVAFFSPESEKALEKELKALELREDVLKEVEERLKEVEKKLQELLEKEKR